MAALVAIDESTAIPVDPRQQASTPSIDHSTNPGVIRIESEDQKDDPPPDTDREQSNPMVFKRAHTVMLTEEMQWFEDDYMKLEPLGEPGTFGMAFKCYKKGAASTFYAVKQINKAKFYFNESQGVLQNMKNEIQIMNTLSTHDHICKLHDTYEDRNYIYLILDFLSGGELYGRIEESEELEETEAQSITKQILSAIEYMQQHKVAHLDLKPDNILFVSSAPDARIKIIDFGEARMVQDKCEKLNQKIGTPYYMAPEIIREVPYEPFPADMWSVGVIVFCMLFGFVPFHAEEENEIFENIKKGFRNEIIDGYGAFFPKDIPISEDAMDIISGMLTSEPSQRLTVHECLKHRWIRRGDLISRLPSKSRLSLPARTQKRQSMKKLFLIKEDPITIVEEDEDATLGADFVHIEAPQNGIIKKGYLKKEGKLFKSWKKRWFLLQNNGCVSYYANHKDLEKPIATFSIVGANILKSSKMQHGIIICTLQRNWKFACMNEKQRNEWVAAFEAAAKPKHDTNRKKKHTLHVDTKAFNKLLGNLHETDALSPAQLNRDDQLTQRIESEINRKLVALQIELDIPENAREKMLQLDQTQKIQMIQQHLVTKMDRERRSSKQDTTLNHYKGTKSLHLLQIIPPQRTTPIRPTAASFSLAVQSTQIQKKRKTAQYSMFGDKHNIIVMALINALKTRIKVVKNDADIVSFVDKVFCAEKCEGINDKKEAKEEEDGVVLHRARTDVVLENIPMMAISNGAMERSSSVHTPRGDAKKYVCRTDETISFATWTQCIQYMLKEEWEEDYTQRLYAKLLKYISLNHKAKIFSIGIDRKTRQYFLKSFKDCFVGNEAIDWLIKAKFVKNTDDNRERAKDLGNSFYTKGFIKHVSAQHKFKDEKLWYQINDAVIDKRCLMETNSMQKGSGGNAKSFVD